MGRAPRRQGLARAAAIALIVAALFAALATPANAGWRQPVRLAAPFSLDLLPPALGFSASGAAAVVFGVQDADAPGASTGYATWRTARGQISRPRRVPGVQEVLDVAFDGPAADLLTGASPTGDSCCSTASVVQLTSGGSFRRRQTLTGKLAGAMIGSLIALGGETLAAVATGRGVWVSQSVNHGRFGPTHRLTAADASPESLQAAALPHGGAVLAWTETRPAARASGPRDVFVATGSRRKAPGGPHADVMLSAGRQIDELGLVTSTAATTLAWIESSYDSRGNYLSDVAVMDLTGHRAVKHFAVTGAVASGLTFGSDARGDQVLAWKTCTEGGSCAVRAAIRTLGHKFTSPLRVDAIDASESPVVAVAARGGALLGWIHDGHVVSAGVRRGATRPSAIHVVSRTGYAADLALRFSPSGDAIAVWSQGTLAPEVVGAVYSG